MFSLLISFSLWCSAYKGKTQRPVVYNLSLQLQHNRNTINKCYITNHRSKNFPKILEPPPNSRCQKGEQSKFYAYDPQLWSDMWNSMLLGAFSQVYFAHKEKNCNSYIENIRCHCTKFSHLAYLTSRICSPFLYVLNSCDHNLWLKYY